MKKLTVLESLRGFASIYVAIGHYILSLKNIPSYISLPFRFGQEAVIIFFILSGFVIFYSQSRTKNDSLRGYFIKRFRRIYFPLIFALLASIVFVNSTFSIKELIGNLLMLQDFETGKPGNIVSPFLGNSPLWSLSYEWTFYLMFPFIFPVIACKKHRVHVVGVLTLMNLLIYILFPNHIFLVIAYFFIWWTGLELGEYFVGDSSMDKIKTLFPYYGIFIAILGSVCYINYRNSQSLQAGIYPFLILRHFTFALLCLFVSVYLTGIANFLARLLKPFSFIAPISYGIYILHYPVWVQTHFAFPLALELFIKLVIVVGIAYIVEIVLQPRINRIIK